MSLFRPSILNGNPLTSSSVFGGESSPFAANEPDVFGRREYTDSDYDHLGFDEDEQEDDSGFVDTAADIGKGIVYGAGEAGRSMLGLFDMIGFDIIPDELHDDPWFEDLKPQGTGGNIASGLAQFTTGFIPGLGVASLLGKATKAGKILNVGEKTAKFTKEVTASAIADFAAFEGHTQRLSNILADDVGLSNVVTEYLKADEDDSELEGRLKNALEGAAIGGAFSSVLAGIKHLKALSKGDAEKAARTKQELDLANINDGNATKPGLEDEKEITNLVEKSDPEDLADTSPPEPVAAPDVDPKAPKGEGKPDVSKLQAPISGPQAIYQNQKIVNRLSEVDSLDELEDVMDELIPELMAKESRTVQEMAAQMIQLDELRGFDSSSIADAVRKGALQTDKDVELITELALRQQVAFSGSRLSFDRQIALAKQIEEGTTQAARSSDESTGETLDELYLLLEAEQKRFSFFTLKQATIGTGVSDIFRARQAGNVGDIQDIVGKQRLERRAEEMYGEVNAAYLADAEDTGLDALNEVRTRRIDETPEADLNEDILKQRQNELARLEKQLESKRRRSEKLSDTDPEEIKGTPEDPGATKKESAVVEKINNDIRVVKEQIQHHNNVFKEERAIIKLREEEHYIDTLSDTAYAERVAKRKASAAKLKKIKEELDPGKANSTVKQLQDLLNQKGTKKLNRAAAAKKLTELRKKLGDLRQSLLEGDLGPKGKLTPQKIKQDPELKEIYEKIQSAQRMLKEERSIPKVLEELKALGRMSDAEFEVTQIINKAEIARKGKGDQSALKKLQELKARYTKARSASLEESGKSIRSKKAYASWKESRPGDIQKGMKDYVDRILFAADQETPLTAFQNGDKLAKMSKLRKFANLGSRWFQRNLISGASTLTLNVGIPQTMRALMRFEQTIGAGIRTAMGDKEAQAVFASSLTPHSKLKDVALGFKAGVKSARTKSDVVTGGDVAYGENMAGAPMNATDPRIWGVDEKTPGGKIFKWIDTFFNWPFAANAGGDGLNKSISATARMRNELDVHVRNSKEWANQSPAAQELWKEEMLQKAIDKDGALYSESRIYTQLAKNARDNVTDMRMNPAAVDQEYERLIGESKDKFIQDQNVLDMIGRTKEYAQEVTATAPIESDVIRMINKKRADYPPLTLLLPFVNTPTNILKFGLQRTPLGAMAELVPRLAGRAAERRAAVAQMSPIQRAEFTGRMATASAGGTALLYFAYLNKDKITGSGPRNPEERRALESTGWRPNSFNLGTLDNPTYVSYQRLDPWATMIGIAADVASFSSMNPDLKGGSMEAAGSLLFAISEGITDKSFLRGLNNVINMVQQPEVYFGKGVRDVVSGLTVPQSLAQFKDFGETNSLIRESRTVVDAVLRKVPIAQENIPPKRTFLGEPVYKQNPLGVLGIFNPIYVSSKKNDSVDKAVLELVHGFGMPSTYYFNHKDTDMREFYNEEGRQAYDRLLELSAETTIGGKTLRESLKGLVNSRQFKAYSKAVQETGGESELMSKDPRIKLMAQVISKYRLKAKNLVIQEFPDLLDTLNNVKKQQNQLNQQAVDAFNNPIPSL